MWSCVADMKGRRLIIKRNFRRRWFPDASMIRSTRYVSPRGFTFIEIVAVIAILGIITAIALPKYFSLMDESKYKVAGAAVAEGNARVSLWGVSQYLKNGTWPTVEQYEAAADSLGTDTGEFILLYRKENETTLRISAEGKVATNFEGIQATLRIKPPGNGGP